MKLKNLLLIALVAIVFCGCQTNYQPTSITVASYNLRNANGGDAVGAIPAAATVGDNVTRSLPKWCNTMISIFSARRSASSIN